MTDRITANEVITSECAQTLATVVRIGNYSSGETVMVLACSSRTLTVVGYLAPASQFFRADRKPPPYGYCRAVILIDDREPEIYCVRVWPTKVGAA